MMRRAYGPWVAVALAAALAGPGCGGGKVPVTGNVLLDGKPLEGATVTFHPAEQGKGQMATGTTDKDGVFRLSTTKPDDGAVPGEYKVTVTAVQGAVAPQGKGMKDAFQGYEKARKETKSKSLVPASYGDAAKTELRQKVPPDGKVTLDLKSGT